MEKRNLIHIECMRIIAAYFVIFNHTENKGFFLFSCYERGSIPYWIYMFISILCKIAVPLFFMIAGALLLKKDMSLKEIWTKKIARMLLSLLVFSMVLYIGFDIKDRNLSLSIIDFFRKLYTNEICIVYWYVYVYIAFLMTVPFLRAIVKTITKIHYEYLFVMYLIFTAIIPCLEYYLFQGNIRMYSGLSPSWLFVNIVFWPLIGYYIENVFEIEKCTKKRVEIWMILGIIGVIISCLMTYYMHGITGICEENSSQMFFATFTVFPCIAIYIGTKYFTTKYIFSRKLRSIVTSISGCTFGIYLLHILAKDYLSGLWKMFRKDWEINKMVAALLFCVIIFFICYGVTLILKKIPILKKIL